MSLIRDELIIVDEDVQSSEEVITRASELLVEFGYVEEGYAEMVIEREKIFPTGLKARAMAIAIPHTDPTLVNKPAIVVTKPLKPVKFKEMGSEDKWLDCEIIFSLVIKDSEKQMDTLKKMIKVLNNDELLLGIKRSSSKSEIKELLTEFDL